MTAANTVKVIVDIVDGIASAQVNECPAGVRVEVETRDYDTENSDPDYIRNNAKLDDTDIPYFPGGVIYDASGQMLTALAAIIARIQGEYDHPALVAYGPLEANALADVQRIARHAFDASAPALSAYQLSELLGRLPVARCIMQPADVLTQCELGQNETGDTEEQHAERLDKAAEWLADNRKYVEEAMTVTGFEAIGNLVSSHEFALAETDDGTCSHGHRFASDCPVCSDS